MSKFSKPKPAAAPAGNVTEADIERVILGADAIDDRRPEPKPTDQDEVRFTMTLSGEMAGRIDVARKKAGGMTRLSWIRLAVAEKLERDGL